MGRVAIFCEESATVREAFKAAGHDAWSFDILPTRIPGQHIQGDCTPYLKEKWDLIIAFPPCTDLTKAGAVYWPIKKSNGSQQKAIDFVKLIYESGNLVAIENPVGILSSAFRKPDQIFHPFHFGDPYKKMTCLWLKGLPKLEYTNVVDPIAHWHSGSVGSKRNGVRVKPKLPALTIGGSKHRSKTFEGIAKAMAEQWGRLLPILFILLTLNLSSQVKFTHFNDLTDFNKHRVVSTGLAWTGTIIGFKKTGEIWKGMLIGSGVSFGIGTLKEGYDMTGRGVPSWKDMGGNLMGSLVG